MKVKVITNSGNLRVRKCPNIDAEICGRLIRDNVYETQKEENGWYYFSNITDNYWGTFSGWASGEFLEVEEDKTSNVCLAFTVDEVVEMVNEMISILETWRDSVCK